MMEKLRVGVLGVGSIGEFHAREFKNSGCDVVAILTDSMESAKVKVRKLNDLYKINARPYSDLEGFLGEGLDIVSVCTPIGTHYDYVKQCLENDINVFCEKPFVFGSSSNYDRAVELFDLAKERGKILSCNTQLVSLLDSVPNELKSNVRAFSMYVEPPLDDVTKLVADAIPHMNSFLIQLAGKNDVDNLKFGSRGDGGISISFDYGNCHALYVVGVKEERPRRFYFDINGTRFDKQIGEGYKQKLVFNENSVDVSDPLSVSVRSFVEACGGHGNTLVSEDEVLMNVKLQDLIIEGLNKIT